MFDGRRNLRSILLAPLRPAHYRAAFNALRTYREPLSELYHYVTTTGTYPRTVEVRTPTGPLRIKLFSAHDLRTVNEIFCRRDYPATADDRVIVDFGSNIGVSALYFLSRGPHCFCYLYEPLPSNVERLRSNLAGYERRVSINPVAVGLEDGEVEFGYESSGRYGGIGLKGPHSLRVECRQAVSILQEILDSHAQIDILKVDIEALEKEILAALPVEQLRRIRCIYVEQTYAANPFPGLYRFHQSVSVARFRRDGA